MKIGNSIGSCQKLFLVRCQVIVQVLRRKQVGSLGSGIQPSKVQEYLMRRLDVTRRRAIKSLWSGGMKQILMKMGKRTKRMMKVGMGMRRRVVKEVTWRLVSLQRVGEMGRYQKLGKDNTSMIMKLLNKRASPQNNRIVTKMTRQKRWLLWKKGENRI